LADVYPSHCSFVVTPRCLGYTGPLPNVNRLRTRVLHSIATLNPSAFPARHWQRRCAVTPFTDLMHYLNSFTTSIFAAEPGRTRMHREKVRVATLVLCRDILRPGQSTGLGIRGSEEIEARTRARAGRERVLGKSGARCACEWKPHPTKCGWFWDRGRWKRQSHYSQDNLDQVLAPCFALPPDDLFLRADLTLIPPYSASSSLFVACCHVLPQSGCTLTISLATRSVPPKTTEAMHSTICWP